MRWPRLPAISGYTLRPSRQALRHAARITVAAVVAFAAAEAFSLPQGFWAVITAIVVMQGSLGATLNASLDRILGTVAGAVVGAGWVVLRDRLALPEPILLAVAVAPMALLAAVNASFRVAPITAVIVLLGAPPGAELLTAFHRMAEIALGCILGGLTAQLVLPDRARGVIEAAAAEVLDALGELAAGHLTREPDASLDGWRDRARRNLSTIGAATGDEDRERSLFLRTGPPAAPMLRSLRRLNSDVAMLGRTTIADPAIDGAAAAVALRTCFAGWAGFLRSSQNAPSLQQLDNVVASVPASSLFAFALTTIRRDLADLADRLSERRGN